MNEHDRRPVTRLGLQIPSFTYPGVSDAELFGRVAEIATTAEDAGFDSVWVMDHLYQIPFMGQRTEPMMDSYTLLSGIAARTSQVRLGAMVTGVTYRNPALLAKIVTTLDVVSSGRAILGIGAAWNEDEHWGYGFEFPPASERLERLEEAVQICRAMFQSEEPTFQGKHYRIERALNFPRPINPGGPPILIGGSGEKKTLRLVAQYADACNLFGDAATVKHKLGVLEQHCKEIGRDPAEITKTRLGGLVIAPTHEEAERRGAELKAARGLNDEYYRMSQIVGDPDEVGEKVQELLDAGLDGLIFNMWGVQELEPVALAGQTLSKVLG
ncbi:MAG TPA: LLM class F420-dependent oxidoreductase [Actinomycetota bacterium]|jgi:F420-dependent oxidoreductase-like protein